MIIIDWTSCMFSYISIYFNNFSKFEVQIQGSVIVVIPKLGRSNDPTWGWRWQLNFEKVRDDPPNLEYDSQHEKFINEIIIYEAVEFFGVQSFGIQIRCSVFRHSVPFVVWSFGVRSFGVGSLFGLGSNSAFGHSVSRLSALGHSAFGHSASRLSAFCRWILIGLL